MQLKKDNQYQYQQFQWINCFCFITRWYENKDAETTRMQQYMITLNKNKTTSKQDADTL